MGWIRGAQRSSSEGEEEEEEEVENVGGVEELNES